MTMLISRQGCSFVVGNLQIDLKYHCDNVQFNFENWSLTIKALYPNLWCGIYGGSRSYTVESLELVSGTKTEDILIDNFWTNLDDICNTLDNMGARINVDIQCAKY